MELGVVSLSRVPDSAAARHPRPRIVGKARGTDGRRGEEERRGEEMGGEEETHLPGKQPETDAAGPDISHPTS